MSNVLTMNREDMIARLLSGGSRKPRQPQEPRGLCPECGKKGLGNTYVGTSAELGFAGQSYRDCKFCDAKVRV